MIANIPTRVKKLCRVTCVGSDRAWISGVDKMIHCVDIHGTVTDTVTSTCPEFPAGITVNRQGELIYSDAINRTVNIVRHMKIETLITTPQGWYPLGLCCTRSGDILVSMCTADNCHLKIVRYQGQKITQEIDKDAHGNAIYQGGNYVVFVTENTNDDIVASDCNAGGVVVVDRTGKVRFRYNDKPPGGQQAFVTTQIVTDSILVGDLINYCFHILDQSG
jgi:uncharacterized protein YbbK (DUF523 family)